MGNPFPARPFTLVTGVIREALRSSGRRVAVVAGDGPEQKLLVGWLERAGIPYETPTPASIQKAEDLINGLDGPGKIGTPDREASQRAPSALAGFALARACDGLLLGVANKTFLLLTPVDGDEPCLPLGDLWASEVQELAGAATLPPVLADLTPNTIRAVDEALEAYYGEGLGEGMAFRHLEPEVRDTVLAALSAARWRWHPRPLIPKLGKTTLGLDLDP